LPSKNKDSTKQFISESLLTDCSQISNDSISLFAIRTGSKVLAIISLQEPACQFIGGLFMALTTEKTEKQVGLQYPRISVVVPARNEAKNLHYVLPFIPSIVDEVILVDGHSTDETIAVAQQLLPDITIIQQEGTGKGDALRSGFAACTGDIIVMLDADVSTDPQEIPRFVEALLDGVDFAKGSRFMLGGGSRDITLLRYLGNYGLCTLVNVLFGTRFSDLCYGFNAFWKHCLDSVSIDCDGFEVEALINLRMHKCNLKIVEIPSFEYERLWGQSNLRTFYDGWRVLKTIIKERGGRGDSLRRLRYSESSYDLPEQHSTSEKIVL
jgi:glycosyltransferase involved in cell wall biosynthesis